MANRFIQQYLSDDGFIINEQGQPTTINLIGNYATPTEFTLQGPANRVFALSQMIVFICDAVTGGFDPAKYGNRAALVNGVQILHTDKNDNIIQDLTHGFPITTNGQWMRPAFNVNVLDNNTNMAMSVLWRFGQGIPQGYEEEGQNPIILLSEDKFKIILEDDFSGLIEHTFIVQGVLLNGPDVTERIRL
jgi:hypothetical protein